MIHSVVLTHTTNVYVDLYVNNIILFYHSW